ncbi:MAG: hypothetical protein ACXAAT_09730 [Candidatus Hodarchaeales archaeon]|jgi:hypothetical protein
MNNVLFFTQLALTFIRLIGLGIGIDFLISRKRKRFQGQVAGWSIWILASIFQILAQNVNDLAIANIFDLIFAICTLLGSFLIAVSIIVYFRPISVKFIFLFTLLLLFSPLVIYILFGIEIAVNFGIFFSFILVGRLYTIGIIYSNNFRTQAGQSVKWFYAMIGTGIFQLLVYIFITLEGVNLGLSSVELENEVLVGVNNTFSIAILVLTVVLLIHLENSRMRLDNYHLKDKYSHDLGNILQVMVSAIHFIEKKELPAEEREKITKLLNQKSQEVSTLIQEIRALE